MPAKEEQQNIDKNDYYKKTKEIKDVGDSGKLTKWYLVMIVSIVYLAMQRLIEYLFGLQGLPVWADLYKYLCLPVSVAFFISAFAVIYWSKRIQNRWREKILSFVLISVGSMIFLLVFASFQVLKPAGLTGFRARIKMLADIPSIRQWISSVDMPKDGLYGIKDENLEKQAPVFIKILKPESVWIVEHTDDKGNKLFRIVNMRWVGILGEVWELSIGPPDLGDEYIPKSNYVLLPVEPGVYIYAIAK